jgi:hypothetical protein
MTTSKSPISLLKAQADKVAATLKAAERGEKMGTVDRSKEDITFGIVMNDKTIKITMPWELIRKYSEATISEYIVGKMRGNIWLASTDQR